MTKYIHFLLLLVLIGLLPHAAAAQQDSLAKYFDDGGLSTRKNIIAVNALSPLVGELSLRYERAIGKRFSVEAGVHPKLPFSGVFGDFSAYYSTTVAKGIGFSGAAHYYFLPHSPEFHYFGPRFRWSRGTMDSGDILTEQHIQIVYGYNLFLSKYLMFCYSGGGGLRFRQIQTPSYLYKEVWLSQHIAVGLGVLF